MVGRITGIETRGKFNEQGGGCDRANDKKSDEGRGKEEHMTGSGTRKGK